MSETSGAFDPNAVEGEKAGGTQYIQLKDLKVWAIALVLLGVATYPVYMVLMGNSERHRCISNLGAVYSAINLYAEQHDNRFPPIARTASDFVTPTLSPEGHPYSWVSDVSSFMNTRQSFVCPTADEAEVVRNESPESSKKTVNSTYGMYIPYGGILTSLVESPDEVVLVAETSNHGAKSTFNPTPFGGDVPDGFAIGWSNSNAAPDKSTTSVTRLAFPDSGKGPTKIGRHGAFMEALTASGKLISLVPTDATFNTGGGINPHWKLPPGYRGPGG
jgi:hypothetical protein